jgi:DNA primase
MNDPVVDAFVVNYGIKNLLDDLDVKKVQNTNKFQLVGCCPFHDERNPSFSINTESGLWRCFGCGLVGNLYQFISLSYNIDYSAAQNFVFVRAGLDKTININDIVFIRDIDLAINENIKDEDVIFPQFSPEQIKIFYESEDPNNYLKNRGFEEKTIQYFECGYTSKWKSYQVMMNLVSMQDL